VAAYKISDKLPSIEEEPMYWAERLDLLLREMCVGIHLSVRGAHQFFAGGREFNKITFSALIRYFLLIFLKAKEFDPLEEEADFWNTRPLSNNGFEVRYNGACIRVRNASGMPSAITFPARAFYQQLLFPEEQSELFINLLVLFRITNELRFDGTLRLIRPATPDENHGNFLWSHKVHYSVPNADDLVVPEYFRPPDLPFDVADEGEELLLFGEDTGTDVDGY
jgi:hypothetical protein